MAGGQYCHRTLPSAELTLDHVIPRSRAGESAWENLVACCHSCNNRKGSRTPEEAGMKLARQPRRFRSGSRHPAVARRRVGLGKPGGLLPFLQQPQGQPYSRGSRHETGAPAEALQLAHQPPPDAYAGQKRCPVAQVPVLLIRLDRSLHINSPLELAPRDPPLDTLPDPCALPGAGRIVGWIEISMTAHRSEEH